MCYNVGLCQVNRSKSYSLTHVQGPRNFQGGYRALIIALLHMTKHDGHYPSRYYMGRGLTSILCNFLSQKSEQKVAKLQHESAHPTSHTSGEVGCAL